jgi:hypothetical protein
MLCLIQHFSKDLLEANEKENKRGLHCKTAYGGNSYYCKRQAYGGNTFLANSASLFFAFSVRVRESTFCARSLRTKGSFGSTYILPRLHIRKCEHPIIVPVSQRDLQQESTTFIEIDSRQ